MFKARLSYPRILNYYLARIVWIFVMPALIIIGLSYHNKTLNNPVTAIFFCLALLPYVSIAILILYRGIVISVDDKGIELDSILDQMEIKFVAKSRHFIAFEQIESISNNLESTATSLGVCSSAPSAPDVWNIFVIKLKGNKCFHCINTLFISKSKQVKLKTLLSSKI